MLIVVCGPAKTCSYYDHSFLHAQRLKLVMVAARHNILKTWNHTFVIKGNDAAGLVRQQDFPEFFSFFSCLCITCTMCNSSASWSHCKILHTFYTVNCAVVRTVPFQRAGLGLNLLDDRVWSLHILPVSAWVFFSEAKDMLIRLTGFSKLPISCP